MISTKKVDIDCTASRAVCPRNYWNSKLVHKISGIQSLSTKFVEINEETSMNVLENDMQPIFDQFGGNVNW